jgi:hypothetical protein
LFIDNFYISQVSHENDVNKKLEFFPEFYEGKLFFSLQVFRLAKRVPVQVEFVIFAGPHNF